MSQPVLLWLCFLMGTVFGKDQRIQPGLVTDGDIILGGLFPVHTYNEQIGGCKSTIQETSILQVEALLYALEQANRVILKDVAQLGIHVYDTCDDREIALRSTLHIIANNTSDGFCQSESHPYIPWSQKHISGLVGPASSQVAEAIGLLTHIFCLPTISYEATSVELQQGPLMSYFLRTVPSDIYQAEGIARLLEYFNWTYVSVVYEDTNYGRSLYWNLTHLLDNIGFCQEHKIKINPDDSDEAYNSAIQRLKKGQARVVVVLLDYPTAQLFFHKAAQGLTELYQWIGVDGWSLRQTVTENNEAILEGTIALQPFVDETVDYSFWNYLQSLSTRNLSNPWLAEYIAQSYNCCFPLGNDHCNKSTVPPCTGDGWLTFSKEKLGKMQYVMNAVYAFAFAFRDISHQFCQAQELITLQEPQNPPQVSGPLLLQALKKVEFPNFAFYNGKNGPPLYSIFQFHQSKWELIGKYDARRQGSGGLSIHAVPNSAINTAIINSTNACYQNCPIGSRRTYEKCCWACTPCTALQIVAGPRKDNCTECRLGSKPNPMRLQCIDEETRFIDCQQLEVILCLVFALSGAVLTACVSAVFYNNRVSPMVKASSRELSTILLGSLMFQFLLPLAYLIPPTALGCAVLGVLSNLLTGLCASVILVKTVRISRLFIPTPSKVPPRYVGPKSQVLAVLALVAINLTINILRLVYNRPTIELTREGMDTYMQCSAKAYQAELCLSLIYSTLVLLITAALAFKARKVPYGYNESRYVLFCVATVLLIYIIGTPIYFAAETVLLRQLVHMYTTVTYGYAFLCCMFLPKVYILLKTPSKNTPQRVLSRVCYQANAGPKWYTEQQIRHNSTDAAIQVEENAVQQTLDEGTMVEEQADRDELQEQTFTPDDPTVE